MYPLADSAESQLTLTRVHRDAVEAAGIRGGPAIGARIQAVAALAFRGHYADAVRASDSLTLWILPEAAVIGAIPRDSAARIFAGWLESKRWQDVAPASLFWAHVGDTASIMRVVDSARAVLRARPSANVPLPFLGGLLALARHDTAAAIRHLSVDDSLCVGWCQQARFVLGPLLSASRQDTAAARILQQDFSGPTGLRVLWALEQARVNERLGRKPQAIDGYFFVESAWRRGDPAVQTYVQEARDALRRLGADVAGPRP
jgi:hypothetical protein